MILIAGEALVDMVASNKQQFTGVPGGSAYNVACALGLLDANVTFACPFSQDSLGSLLLDRLQHCGVSAFLPERVDAPTPLALVTVDENSQPTYSFYREGTADRLLAQLGEQTTAITSIKIMHITGFCLNDATDFIEWLGLVKAAKAQGAIISVDPNVRESLIDDPKEYRERIKSLLAIAHIVKVSDEDLLYLYPEDTLDAAVEALQQLTLLAIITLGSKGADIYWDGNSTHVDARVVDNIVDTVGAGDCFSAAYLYQLNQLQTFEPAQLTELTQTQIHDIVSFASTAAAINCGRKGCQPPTVKEIENYG